MEAALFFSNAGLLGTYEETALPGNCGEVWLQERVCLSHRRHNERCAGSIDRQVQSTKPAMSHIYRCCNCNAFIFFFFCDIVDMAVFLDT